MNEIRGNIQKMIPIFTQYLDIMDRVDIVLRMRFTYLLSIKETCIRLLEETKELQRGIDKDLQDIAKREKELDENNRQLLMQADKVNVREKQLDIKEQALKDANEKLKTLFEKVEILSKK